MIQKLPGNEKIYFPRFLQKKKKMAGDSPITINSIRNSQSVNKVGLGKNTKTGDQNQS